MENIIIGLKVMLIGMGVVFCFLTVMILTMQLSAKTIQIINKYFPEPIEQKPQKKKKKTTDDSEIALAIALAFKKEAERC